ncbi:hypothetical protein AVEN_82755-1 [Araneus ventricosus]|uniref:Uncharacterized protein n=1 Tax=Araneus ventricosus TaxID=182803 RepID=A0A4Y2EBG9_ARAVE|nr:hypothetical protein AVEN_82755-1 [Araneus ventricosus]
MVESRWPSFKRAVKKTPTRIIGPPTTVNNEVVYLPDHPSKEGKRLQPAGLGVKAKPVESPEPRYERVKTHRNELRLTRIIGPLQLLSMKSYIYPITPQKKASASNRLS